MLELFREGKQFVTLSNAVTAVHTVFPDVAPAISYDQVRLTQGTVFAIMCTCM